MGNNILTEILNWLPLKDQINVLTNKEQPVIKWIDHMEIISGVEIHLKYLGDTFKIPLLNPEKEFLINKTYLVLFKNSKLYISDNIEGDVRKLSPTKIMIGE